MDVKRLPSQTVRALVVTFVMLAAGFIFLAQAQMAAAQGTRTELVVGLQNDMTTMNFWNPETNTVWNFYQVEWGFEGLFSHDPDYKSFPVLADPARGATGPGYTVTNPTSNTPTVDVFIRTTVTFQNGQTLTADDVVFTFQTLAWSTWQTSITEALWWDAPLWNHWSGVGKSHIGVEKIDATTVRFHLSKPYALFFFSTMEATIIPKSIWATHINPSPPINITSLTPITDSADLSIDFSYGLDPSETDALIGTGMFKFESWSPNSGSRIVAYDNYWGKSQTHLWKGINYPFFPEHLRSIKFVIYTSLDVISLALQKGEIDTLIWSLTPGFLSQVRFNPSISVEQVTDAGYFYLSFNLRRKPWNDIVMRKAISMAIDKDYIVNTLMGGFGVKGTVPIAIHNSRYINSSAAPPSFDLNAAKALLDANGIVDVNGDGFREYSDGSPIKATILTPPKDYDPVRADAGIMISNNLKAIGLNIDSAPTSFDTIVAKAFTEVDFDIYILGWLLGDFPETYLKDFFHSDSDVAINPAGSNSAGYHNSVVDAKLEQMLVTLNDDTRTQIVKDVEGIVTNDIPWNVLYYRKNLNAYRNDVWVNWVNTPPQLYNFWSLSKLRPAGAVVVPPPTGAFSVALTVPERAIAGHVVPVDVFVSQNLVPVANATVTLNATWGSEYRQVSGNTDVGGHLRFTWTVPVIQGNLKLAATAAKGTSSATTTKLLEITVGPPAPIATLRLSTAKPVIGVGETTTITATLFDGVGGPISGATVSVDKTLLLGNVTPASAATDASGVATFTYTAPATAGKFPNQHLTDILKATVSVPDTVAVDTQQASIVIFVENDNVPDWRIVDVQGSPALSIDSVAGGSTPITVKVTDYAGTALSGKVVQAVLPADNWNVTVTPASGEATTGATGLASFTFTVAAGNGNGTEVPVRFQVKNDAYAVSDEVGLFLFNGTNAGYSAQIDFGSRSLVSAPTPDSTTATVTVTDGLGLPAAGVPVLLQITYGDLGLPAQFPWNYDYSVPEYLDEGLDMNFFGLGSLGGVFQNSSGQGVAYGVENFVEDLEVVGNFAVIDSCDPSTWPADFAGLYYLNVTSVTDATGQLSVPLTAVPHKIDSAVQVRAYVGDPLGSPLSVSADACNFVASIDNAVLRIDSGIVIKRAPVFALGSVTMDQTVFSSDDRTAEITGRFYDLNGPAANVDVILTRGAGGAARNVRGAFGGTIAADATGTVRWNVTVPLASLSQPIYFGFIPADAAYAYGGREQLFSGPGGSNYGDFFFAPTFAYLIAKIPFEFRAGYLFVPTTVAFASASVDKTIVSEGGSATATVTVTTGTGAPIANATVWSGPYQATTDANGVASFNFSASAGAVENLAVITTPDGQILRAWYGILASAPVLSYGAISVTAAYAGQASQISLSVTNVLAVAGTATVVLTVGGQAVSAQAITLGASATQTVTFQYVFDKAQDYTVGVGNQTKTVTIQAAPGPDFVAAYGLGIGLLVVGLVIGAVVGLMLSRRGKKPPTMAPEPEKEEPKAAEEELGPEENL